MKPHLLCVDLQHAFASPGGSLYRPRPCVPFIVDTVLPAARDRGWPIHHIVSDYRDPDRPPQNGTCAPGSWAGESVVPRVPSDGPIWVKSMPSPAWVRDGGGYADARPGPARPDPDGFSLWLEARLGPPATASRVVVVGLMLEICVLSTLQELCLRGYRPAVLIDGVDTTTGDQDQKAALIDALFPFWGDAVAWSTLAGPTPRRGGPGGLP